MRKIILLTLFCMGAIVSFSQAQQPLQRPTVENPNAYIKYGWFHGDKGFLFTERDTFPSKYPALIKHTNHKLYTTNGEGAEWKEVGGGVSNAVDFDTLSYYVKIVTQSPTSTLTGGAALELMATGASLPYTLNWVAGRLSAGVNIAATTNISSIVVAGVAKSFVNPSSGLSVNGTQNVSVIRNTNTTYANLVTTIDGKTANSTTSFTFDPKRYWFYSSTTTPSSSDIVTALGGSSELTNSKAKASPFDVVVTGATKYVSYAYPSSYGVLSSIIISGLESIGVFTLTTASVTNASGYVQNYYVYTTNNYYNNTTISFNSIN